MSIIDSMKFVGSDERCRRFLLPEAVVSKGGSVTKEETLLIEKTFQIGLNETEYAVLENGGDGPRAFVVLDFGRELHGGIRLLTYWTHGAVKYPELRITFGESLTETNSVVGCDTSTNDHAVRQMTVPVPALSDQEWGQTGFRFVRIELMTPDSAVELKSALAVFVYRDYEYLGDFKCSDERINRIYDTAAYTCHLNLQNMVWDGIKRDRLVWIGDMMPESMTTRNLFGTVDIVEKSIEFARCQTPLPMWMNGYPSYSMWWILIVWDWYMASGDSCFLQREKGYASALLSQICDGIDDDGTLSWGSHFLDWPTAETKESEIGVRALLKMALGAGARMAEHIGDRSLAERCFSKIETLNRKTEPECTFKQVAALRYLSGELSAQKASRIIAAGHCKGLSTFLLYFVLKALCESGEHELSLTLLTDYSLQMLDKGATSFWEDYDAEWYSDSSGITTIPTKGKRDIHADYGRFCYKGLRHSLCHGWASGAVPFLTECVMGVTILEPGCKTLKIQPHMGNLEWVRGRFPTPYGTVGIEHKRGSDGTIETKVDAPKEVNVILTTKAIGSLAK